MKYIDIIMVPFIAIYLIALPVAFQASSDFEPKKSKQQFIEGILFAIFWPIMAIRYRINRAVKYWSELPDTKNESK